METKYIREMDDGTVIVDRGPMLMSIFTSNGKTPNRILAKEGAKKALEVLEILTHFRKLITQNIREIGSNKLLPSIISKMVFAARKFEDSTVTPLIGVAGIGADEVANFIFKAGETSKVIVNNGGDIAIRLRNQDLVRVGIKTNLRGMAITHILTVTEASCIRGVATSGFGGRSLTRGVANAAVAVAADAISADIAATLIGNATNIESPNVVKVFARDLDEFTDIPDLLVTKSIRHLENSQVNLALDRGMRKATAFRKRGLIIGAFLAVKDQHRISESIFPFVQQQLL